MQGGRGQLLLSSWGKVGSLWPRKCPSSALTFDFDLMKGNPTLHLRKSDSSSSQEMPISSYKTETTNIWTGFREDSCTEWIQQGYHILRSSSDISQWSYDGLESPKPPGLSWLPSYVFPRRQMDRTNHTVYSELILWVQILGLAW